MVKITIVIPYFKLDYLEDTLSSLANQENKNFSVFIGDDNSPQDPSFLLEKFQTKLNINYKRYSKNLGSTNLAEHWKRCLQHVDTEWFIILGDDDMLSKNAISEFYHITNYKIDTTVLRYSTQIIDENRNKISKIHVFSDSLLSSEFIYKKSKNELRSSLSEYIYRLDDFKTYGIKNYPKAFYSDDMMMLTYSKFGKVVNIVNATVFVRISNKSLSGNAENKQFLELASFQFYNDLVNDYSSKFARNQLSMFLNILMKGVKQKKIKVSVYSYFYLCFRKIGFSKTLRKIITYLRF